MISFAENVPVRPVVIRSGEGLSIVGPDRYLKTPDAFGSAIGQLLLQAGAVIDPNPTEALWSNEVEFNGVYREVRAFGLRNYLEEDDVQEGIINLWLKGGQSFPNIQSAKAYVRKAATHKAIDRTRYDNRRPQVSYSTVGEFNDAHNDVTSEPAVPGSMEDRIIGLALVKELAKLIDNPLRRRAFVLAAILGLGHEEISAELGKKPNNVRQLIFRGKNDLLAEISEKDLLELLS